MQLIEWVGKRVVLTSPEETRKGLWFDHMALVQHRGVVKGVTKEGELSVLFDGLRSPVSVKAEWGEEVDA